MEKLDRNYARQEFSFTIEGHQFNVTAGNKKKEPPKEPKEEPSKEEPKDPETELNQLKEKNEISDNIAIPTNLNTKSIGIVMYGSSDLYEDDTELNKDIHIPHAEAPSILAPVIKKIFELLYKSEINELIMGHEHGEDNKKCHLQIIITFPKNIRKILTVGYMVITWEDNKVKLIYMQQKAKNPYALKNYCQKDRDATIVKKDNSYSKKLNKSDISGSPFAFIVDNKDKLTYAEAMDIIAHKNPKSYFTSFNQIKNAVSSLITPVPPVPFEWLPVPEYLKHYTLPNYLSFYDTFNEWYQKYCINGENLPRKKALCLYSEKRALGKSYFVRHLVPHPDYILEFNNTFTQKGNINSPIHKLLLLDDMGEIDANNITMWKSLVASEPTTLRSAWLNEYFDRRLPCIITTNNSKMIELFYKSSYFNTQVVLIEIKEYMGEPGTQREDLTKYEFIISDELARKLNK